MTEDQYKFEETDFNEIIFTVNSEKTDVAGDIVNMVVPYGIYIEDYRNLEEMIDEIAHIDLIDEELKNRDRTKSKIHIYIDVEKPYLEAISFVEERFNAMNIEFECEVKLCKTDDWANNWKKYFHPIEIGERLLICPSWEEKPKTDRKILTLEPGLAFGTGTHETTALCLELVERYVKKGDRILDVGTGSGILAVAGLLLGADYAFGVDIDDKAVKVAKENAVTNGVGEKFEAVCGSLTEKAEGKFDVITANIVADVILIMLEDIARFMTKDTLLILSGIISSRADDVVSALSERFETVEYNTKNEWVAIAVKLK